MEINTMGIYIFLSLLMYFLQTNYLINLARYISLKIK